MKFERIGITTDWIAVAIAVVLLALLKSGIISKVSF